MARSTNEVLSDPHFGLKIIVLVVGVFVHFFILHVKAPDTYNNILINGYHYSYLTVISSLILAYVFFETTKVTEICLLIAALVQLLIVTVYAEGNDQLWNDNVQISVENSNVIIERNENKYYMFIVGNIGSAVLILIDVILQAGK